MIEAGAAVKTETQPRTTPLRLLWLRHFWSAGRLSLGQATLASAGVEVTLAAATLLTTPLLISRLGAESYGILGVISVLAGQLSLLHLGLAPAVMRRVAACRGRGDLAGQAAAQRAACWLGAGASLLLVTVFAVIVPLAWTRALQSSPATLHEALTAIPAAVFVVGAQPILGALFGYLLGEERFRTLAALRLAHGLGRTAVAVAAIVAGGRVMAVLLTHAAVDALTVSVAWRLTQHSVPGPIPWRATAQAARSLLALGLPFALAGVFAGLLVDGEKLAIGMARSVADFTYYVVPFNTAFRLTVFANALGAALMPRLTFTAAAGATHAAAELTRRATRLSVSGMTVVSAVLVAAAPELLQLWLGAEFAARAHAATRIILVALLANIAASAAYAALQAQARPTTLTILYALELPLHLVVVYVLVRAWGVEGAALAWGVRVTLDAVAQRALAARAFKARIGGWAEMWVPLLLVAALAAGCQWWGQSPLLLRLSIALALGAGVFAWLLERDDWLSFRRAVTPWA